MLDTSQNVIQNKAERIKGMGWVHRHGLYGPKGKFKMFSNIERHIYASRKLTSAKHSLWYDLLLENKNYNNKEKKTSATQHK